MSQMQAINKYVEACGRGDQAEATGVLQAAFQDPSWTEIDMHNLAAAIYNGREKFPFFEAIGAVSRRYPESVLPAQAFWSSVLTLMGKLDDATEEGRHYLSKVKEKGLMASVGREPSLQIAVGIAFLSATAAYTELGWRSYSLRILNLALQSELTPTKREYLVAERRVLESELTGPEAARQDGQWEEFYRNGAGANELVALCDGKGFPTMAKRVELLESEFRFGKTVAFESEFFLCVWSGRKDEQVTFFLQ